MWMVLIPVVGVIAAIALWPKEEKKPGVTATWGTPGGPSTAMPGSARAITYMQRLDAGLMAWKAVRLIGGSAAASALATLKGTLDVVPSMALTDVQKGRITEEDMAAISAKVDSIKEQIS